jgi:glycosyltransferase involved in cell wall biosynthesis
MTDAQELRVAMDVSVLRRFNTGTEEFIEGLVGGLSQVGLGTVGLGAARPLDPAAEQLGQPLRDKRSPLAKWLWETRTLSRLAERTGADVVHIPYLAHPPQPLHVPTVVTVHDLIPYRFPGYQRRWRDRTYFAQLKPRLSHASRLVAISAATQEDIQLVFPELAGRAVVIPNGVHDVFYAPPSAEALARLAAGGADPDRPRVLYIGGYAPHKNVRVLLHAAAAVLPSREAELVLVGAADAPDVLALAHRAGLAGLVRATGRVSRAELRAWYSCATVFAFPSRYEGFGLPPAQALAAGVPVAAARTAAVEEVLGPAALWAEPDDVDAWTANLAQLLDDAALRDRLRQAGRTRAASYRWRAVAARYADVYREVAQR